MPNPAQELTKQITSLIETLANETDAARQSELFTAYLNTCAAFHTYSWHNQMLIWCQRPAATRVAGFRTWQKLSRFVRKGEKGIKILAPMYLKVSPRERECADAGEASGTQTKRLWFRVVYVFDVAQTDGQELPRIPMGASGEVGNLIERLEAFAASEGISVRYLPDADMGSAYGYSTGKAIAVRESLTGANRAAVLIHELTHELLHWTASRELAKEKGIRQRELEAEATAFVVAGHFGVRNESAFYLASYGVDAAQLRASLETIQRTAKRLIDACADVLSEVPLIISDAQPEALPVAA